MCVRTRDYTVCVKLKENLVKLQGHEKKLLQIFLYPIVFYLKNNMNISLHSDKDLSMLRFTTSIGFNKNAGRSKYF